MVTKQRIKRKLSETAEYFENLFKDRCIPDPPKDPGNTTPRNMGNTKPLTQRIKPKEVKNTIKSLKNGKATGPDLIPNEFLKLGAKILTKPLCKLSW